MHDDKSASDYNLEGGSTLHLVSALLAYRGFDVLALGRRTPKKLTDCLRAAGACPPWGLLIACSLAYATILYSKQRRKEVKRHRHLLSTIPTPTHLFRLLPADGGAS